MEWHGPFKHARAGRIAFVPDGHRYFVDGVAVPQSATSVVGQCFPFDAERIVSQNVDRWYACQHSEYFPLIDAVMDGTERGRALAVAAIVASWKRKGIEAAVKGTQMHAAIERDASGQVAWAEGDDTVTVEVQQYRSVATRLAKEGWVVAGVEVLVFYEVTVSEDDPCEAPGEMLVFAGAIDMLLRHPATGKYRMVDHKRVPLKRGKFLGDAYKQTSSFDKANYPFESFENSSSFKYAAQLNLYAYALKHRYGIDCEGRLDLLQLHESLPEGGVLVRVPTMSSEVARVLQDQTAAVRVLEGTTSCYRV